MEVEKPEHVTEEHLLYLDQLRESGVTNMFGAVPFILLEFPDLSEQQAKQVLIFWMKTFSVQAPQVKGRSPVSASGYPNCSKGDKMLNQEDFDFYYLIICSRGPGSETIVVDNVSDRRDALHFYEGSEDQFKKIGACEAGADFNDEGPIIAVPRGTKPLKAIYEWIKQDVASLEAENGADFFSSSRLLGALQLVEKTMAERGVDSDEVHEMRKQAEKLTENQPASSQLQTCLCQRQPPRIFA